MVLVRTDTIIKYYNLIAEKKVTTIEEIPLIQYEILRNTEIKAMQYALAVHYIKNSKHQQGRKTMKARFPAVSLRQLEVICRTYRLLN